MTSYNDRPNDYESVSKCGCFVWQDLIDRIDLLWMQISETNLEQCITITHQTRPGNVMVCTDRGRRVYVLSRWLSVHFTSVTDTRNTQTIISNGTLFSSCGAIVKLTSATLVRDIILTGNLKSSSLM